LNDYVATPEPTAPTAANPVPLHTSLLDDYVERNNYDDDDDEYIADYIDLVLFAIVSNVELTKTYQLNPTESLLLEIRNNSRSIAKAKNCLNIHIRRLIQKFKSDINFDGIMSVIENQLESDPHTVDVDPVMIDHGSNPHIQPTFFLEDANDEDANDEDIAAYIDLIIAAIQSNLQRQMEYLRNPSPQLRQEIREHSMSIATAENCTNVHIQRIVRNFEADIHYDDIMPDDGVADTTISLPFDIAVTQGMEF
jgi:hypothetical protein